MRGKTRRPESKAPACKIQQRKEVKKSRLEKRATQKTQGGIVRDKVPRSRWVQVLQLNAAEHLRGVSSHTKSTFSCSTEI